MKQLYRMRPRIETRKTIIGAQPQPIVAIRLDPVHDLARHSAEAGLVFKAHCARLGGAADHAIEAAAGGADPQPAAVVQVQRVNRVVAETGRIPVVAPVRVETPGSSIEQIQPAAFGADPEIAEGILDDGARARAAERGGTWTAKGVTGDRTAVRIDARQAAAECAH